MTAALCKMTTAGSVFDQLKLLVDREPASGSWPAMPPLDQQDRGEPLDQKLPERVVYDTSLPTIVPPAAATQIAAAPAAPAADVGAQAQVRDTFAQFVPAEAKKFEKQHESQAPRKRKIAKIRPALPMRVAQQPHFGFGFSPGKPSRIAREHLDSVCPRASDRRSAGIVFRGNGLRVSLPPPVGAGQAPHPARRQSRE